MNDYLKSVASQSTAIIIAAAGAALFTFFQSMATQAGVCPGLESDPTQAGALGALLKGIHGAFTNLNHKV